MKQADNLQQLRFSLLKTDLWIGESVLIIADASQARTSPGGFGVMIYSHGDHDFNACTVCGKDLPLLDS